MWHLDGQHKLVEYGFIVHSTIDGKTRFVPSIRASSNNLAATMLDVVLEGCERCGVPAKIRGDRGSENVLIAAWIYLHRGENRGSFSWGTYVLSLYISLHPATTPLSAPYAP